MNKNNFHHDICRFTAKKCTNDEVIKIVLTDFIKIVLTEM